MIKKSIRDVDLLDTARAAFKEGWRHIKLYFIVGLPFETHEDILGIVETARRVSAMRKEIDGQKGDVNVTISPFVPKPHTAYQWSPMEEIAITRDKIEILKQASKRSRAHLKLNDPRKSYVEAVFARGDRRLFAALLAAKEEGCRFDEWNEHFDLEKWMRVFERAGIDPNFYARRERSFDEVLPWDHLSSSVPKDFLVAEMKRATATNEQRKAAAAQSATDPATPVV
ncbi:MAG: hypothetical protein A2Z34_11165 [Planctomycetes bacterium RBG_16_59_8]|nr:MAG: hypothetical protein A2Z34_11165 [Planctomycetes bacterium RBG_16_59_8]